MTESGTGSPAQQTPGAPPPAPSPLSGCYLLIVIGEPHSPEHKEIILQRIAKGRTTACTVAMWIWSWGGWSRWRNPSMFTPTVALSRHYFRFWLHIVSFNILLRHNLLCVEIELSKPSLIVHLITLLQFLIIRRRMMAWMDYRLRMNVRFVGGDLFVEVQFKAALRRYLNAHSFYSIDEFLMSTVNL